MNLTGSHPPFGFIDVWDYQFPFRFVSPSPLDEAPQPTNEIRDAYASPLLLKWAFHASFRSQEVLLRLKIHGKVILNAGKVSAHASRKVRYVRDPSKLIRYQLHPVLRNPSFAVARKALLSRIRFLPPFKVDVFHHIMRNTTDTCMICCTCGYQLSSGLK